jgi:hypothetical protein
LEEVLNIGYPVLWNVTLTGLGGSEVEPKVPPTDKALKAIIELSGIVPAQAILWRYDPIFISEKFGAEFHVATFSRLVEQLAGRVDRVTTSFVEVYGRRVKPDLVAYQTETGDGFKDLFIAEKVRIAARIREIAESAGVPFTLCCSPEVRKEVDCSPAGCNRFEWACRVYPELRQHRQLRDKPTRPDCGCSEEIDIGVYDTCIYGCRYSYGSCNDCVARQNFNKHDPEYPCILPLEIVSL